MYNEILDAVSGRLEELFPGCAVYREVEEQGMQRPCFLIGFLEPSEKPMMGRRYFRESGMNIQYFPAAGGELSRVLYEAADTLMDGLEYVTAVGGQLLHGTRRKYKIVDGTLHFLVNYNMFVVKKTELEPSMEQIKTDVKTKGS